MSLFLLPFIIRLLYCIDTYNKPYFQTNLLVSSINESFAEDIVSGNASPYLLLRSPYYPILLAQIYKLIGIHPYFIRVLQWLLGAIGCLLVFYIAGIHFGKKTACIALLLSSLYAPFVYFEGELLEQSFVTFFSLLAITCFSLCLKRIGEPGITIKTNAGATQVSLRKYFSITQLVVVFAGAVCLGIAFLMRPALVLSVPFLLVSFFLLPAPLKTRLQYAGTFIAGCIIMIYLSAHPDIFLDVDENHIAINAAINLYLGNNPNADGYNPVFYDIPNIRSDHPEAMKHHITELTLAGILYAKAQVGNDLSAVVPFWLRKTTAWMRSEPLKFLALELKKIMLFFNGFIITNQKDIYFMREFSYVLYLLLFNALICFPLGIIFPLSFFGVYMNRQRFYTIFLLASIPAGCLLTTLIFFHNSRFQYPSIPYFILFCSVGIISVENILGQRVWKQFIFLIICLIIANWDFFGTHSVRWDQEYFNLGTMYLDNNQYQTAEKMYKKSLAYNSNYMPSLMNLAMVYAQSGNYREGIDFFTAHYTKNSPSWAVMYSIAELYWLAGNKDEALKWGLKTLGQFPDHGEVYYLLGEIYTASNQLSEAEHILRQGVQKFPHALLLHINLGSVMAMEGKHEMAIPIYYKVLSKAQHYPQVYVFLASSLVAVNKPHQAETVLEQAVSLYPSNHELRLTLAKVYEILNKPEKQKQCYLTIIKTGGKHPDALFQLARLFMRQKQFNKALSTALQAQQAGHPQADHLINIIRQTIHK